MRFVLGNIRCLALTLFLLPAFAGNDKNTYLALGDSVAFGLNPLLIGPYPQQPASADKYVGYPEVIAALEDLTPSKTEVNASCPGESSGSFLYGKASPDIGCNSPHVDPLVVPFREIGLHANYAGTQMEFAISQLKTNKRINLVTLGIGSNDVLLALQKCGGDPLCVDAELRNNVLPAYASNLATILTGIRAEYQGTLILVGYYSPSPALDGITKALNDVTIGVAAALASQPGFAPVKYADGLKAFKTFAAPFGGDPCRAGLVIRIPGTNPAQCDIHPTTLGQAVLAATVELAKVSKP